MISIKRMGIATTILGTMLASMAQANMPTRYEMTITNGSQMPISPATIYVKNGADAAATVGAVATAGFVQLCQTGNPMLRSEELKMVSAVQFSTQTMAPILPGESRIIEVEVADPQQQSLHFEGMYGKSKDACAVGSINSHSLVALKQHVSSEFVGKDDVLVTGAFSEPSLPAGSTQLDPNLCSNAKDGITCLRELSMPLANPGKIRFFGGYFPSIVNALEQKYGAADVQTLVIPTSGAVQFRLKLKH